MNLAPIKKINFINFWKLVFLISFGYIIFYSVTETLKEKAKIFLINFKEDIKKADLKIKESQAAKALIDSASNKISSKKNNEEFNKGTKFGRNAAIGIKFMFKSKADKIFYFSLFMLIISSNILIFSYFIRKSDSIENKIIASAIWIIISCTILFWFIVFTIDDFRFQLTLTKISLIITLVISTIHFTYLLIKSNFYPQDFEVVKSKKNVFYEKFSTIYIKTSQKSFVKKWGIWIMNFVVLLLVLIADHYLPNSSTRKETFFQGTIFSLFGIVLVLLFSLIVGSFHYKLIHKTALRNDKGVGNYTLYFLLNFLLYLSLLSFTYYIFKGSTLEKDMDTIPTFIFALALIYSLFSDFKYNRTLQEKLEKQRNRAELSTLKAQVNPHFLFNTLNNLYGTAIVEEADKTAAGIYQLAGIMRHVVEESKHESTPIEKEIKFLGDFIELNKIRLPNRENIKVSVKIKYDEKSFLIAPLLLIPFVENAFKYGISIKDDCFVDINLNIVEDKIHFHCRNSIIKNNNLEPSTGTGIDNVRKRLELNYPNKHQLDITDKGSEFLVNLELDLS